VAIRVVNPDQDEGASNTVTTDIDIPLIFLPMVVR
jgi:hypothetical protein